MGKNDRELEEVAEELGKFGIKTSKDDLRELAKAGLDALEKLATDRET